MHVLILDKLEFRAGKDTELLLLQWREQHSICQIFGDWQPIQFTRVGVLAVMTIEVFLHVISPNGLPPVSFPTEVSAECANDGDISTRTILRALVRIAILEAVLICTLCFKLLCPRRCLEFDGAVCIARATTETARE